MLALAPFIIIAEIFMLVFLAFFVLRTKNVKKTLAIYFFYRFLSQIFFSESLIDTNRVPWHSQFSWLTLLITLIEVVLMWPYFYSLNRFRYNRLALVLILLGYIPYYLFVSYISVVFSEYYSFGDL